LLHNDGRVVLRNVKGLDLPPILPFGAIVSMQRLRKTPPEVAWNQSGSTSAAINDKV
jgi:hypothetical protein